MEEIINSYKMLIAFRKTCHAIGYDLSYFYKLLVAILLTAVTVSVIVLVFYRRKKLPPINPESMLCTLGKAIDGTLPDFILLKLKDMGKVIRLNLPQMSYYCIIGDAYLAKKISEEEVEKPPGPKRLTLNNASIFSKKTLGENWEMNRKGVASSFSVSNLSKSLPGLHQKIGDLFCILDKYAQQETTFEITELMLSLAMDFISSAMFGVNSQTMRGDQHSEGGKILQEMKIAMKEIVLKQRFDPFRSWMFWNSEVQRGDEAARYLMATQQKILDMYRASNSPEAIAKDSSILAHLVRCPYPTDEERCADMLAFMIAGHDTIAFSLSWILIEVARHPDVQQRIQQEIQTVVPSYEKHLLPSHLAELPYLECVIKEGMRLWPVAALGSLRLASKDIPYKDFIIPKGSTLMIPFYPLFRTADIQDPERFLPDRWAEDAPEEEKQRLKDSFFPFALGKRNCVGQNLAKMELRLILASMLRSYRFELQTEFSKDYFLTMKPVNAMFRVYKL